jgi:hypothetical protein
MNREWFGKNIGIPPKGAFSPRLEDEYGNWKHGLYREIRERLQCLKVNEYIEGPMPLWEKQAHRIARYIGIKIATCRVKENNTVRIYRVS